MKKTNEIKRRHMDMDKIDRVEDYSDVVQAIAVETGVSLDTARQMIENGDAIDLGQLGSVRDFGCEVWWEGYDGFDLTREQRQALEEVVNFEEVAERVRKHHIVVNYGTYGECWAIVWE